MFGKFICKAEHIAAKANQYIARSSAAIIAVIIALIIIDVTGRWVFNQPLPGCTEITSVCLSYIAFMSYAYGLTIRSYVRVEVLFMRFPQKVQIVVELITNICGLIIFYIIFRGGWAMFLKSFLANEMMPASVQFPYWLPKLFVPLGSLIMIVQCLIYCLSSICRLSGSKEEYANE